MSRDSFFAWFSLIKVQPKVGHFWQCCLTTAFAKWPLFFHFSRWCHFLNIGCFLNRFLHRIAILLLSRYFCMLLALNSSNSEETVFVHLFLACYTLRKMVNFATFQNRVILLMLSGFWSCFSHKTSLMCVKSHFLYDFRSLCKMGNVATLQNCVFF